MADGRGERYQAAELQPKEETRLAEDSWQRIADNKQLVIGIGSHKLLLNKHTMKSLIEFRTKEKLITTLV